MLAQVCGYDVGDFVHTIGDAHIYLNHVEQVKVQLERPILAPPIWLIRAYRISMNSVMSI